VLGIEFHHQLAFALMASTMIKLLQSALNAMPNVRNAILMQLIAVFVEVVIVGRNQLAHASLDTMIIWEPAVSALKFAQLVPLPLYAHNAPTLSTILQTVSAKAVIISVERLAHNA
jgi:hypothetical protein